VAQRLSDFLGDPKVGPNGKPIPLSVDDPSEYTVAFPLRDLGAGATGEVVLLNGDATDRGFLANHGVAPGVKVMMLAGAGDGGVLISTPAGRLSLAKQIADLVGVVPA
jgi:Fe2+ transport system protein FeoA